MLQAELLISPELAQLASEKRTNPGVIVLSYHGRLYYANFEARELCAQINKARLGKVVRGVLPVDVLTLCGEIANSMGKNSDIKDWAGAQLRRVIDDLTPPVLLRAFAFGDPSPINLHQARIVILMEPIVHRRSADISQAQERFQLTNRNCAVVRCLARGFTNKEIAQELGITEQTVKEHVRRLMRKTRMTTRTGVLARLLHVSDSDNFANP